MERPSESTGVLHFRLPQERRQELLLEAAELHERRQEILRILGMVATTDHEDLF